MGKHYINSAADVDEVIFVDADGDEFTVSKLYTRNDVLSLSMNNNQSFEFLRKDIPNLIKLLEEADRLL